MQLCFIIERDATPDGNAGAGVGAQRRRGRANLVAWSRRKPAWSPRTDDGFLGRMAGLCRPPQPQAPPASRPYTIPACSTMERAGLLALREQAPTQMV
ncbi:MAG TPA: hypothetical protein VF043_12835 [Ktedonobacteraceae bacterium]